MYITDFTYDSQVDLLFYVQKLICYGIFIM